MKVRGDFVTNSSSVSYILTMKEEIMDIGIKQVGGSKTEFGNFLIYIKEKIIKKGNKMEIEGDKIHYLKVNFDTDDWHCDISKYDHVYEMLEGKDVKKMSDGELTCYMNYAILNKNLMYIGATRVETY